MSLLARLQKNKEEFKNFVRYDENMREGRKKKCNTKDDFELISDGWDADDLKNRNKA